MVRRNPRIDPASYQRDDEHRSTEGYRPVHPERGDDVSEPSSDWVLYYAGRDNFVEWR